MISMIYKGVYLSFLFIFLVISIYKILRLEEIKRKKLVIMFLIVVGFLLAFYVRFIVYQGVVFASFDEANYIDLLYRLVNDKPAVISGPGFVYILIAINYISGLDFITIVPMLAIIVTIVSLAIIYGLYRIEIKNPVNALLSCILLISTSYFLWPIIESRPQQIGMILFFLSSILFYKYLKDEKFFFIFLVSYFITFIFHILSFFILSGCVLLLGYWQYLSYKGNLKKFIYLLASFFVCMFLFSRDWFIYNAMREDISTLFYEYPMCLIKTPFYLIQVFIFTIFFIVVMTYILKNTKLSKYAGYLKHRSVFVLLILSVIFALFLQYRLGSVIHSSLYKDSILYFFFFQLGNLFFGIMFLIGLYDFIKKGKTGNIFFKYSIALMILGFMILIFSFFFPLGLNNGLIRVINYWTLFAAPIALVPIIKIRWKLVISILIALLILISLVNTSKDPYFFNYELYWDDSDFSAINWLCLQNGSFFINHTTNDFNPLSKESSYDKLISILEKKNKTVCKSKRVRNIKNETDTLLVYEGGNIRIYKVRELNSVKKSFKRKVGWDLACPSDK